MESIDRYLQLVRTFLPKPEQDDIIRELQANLLSQIEDKESEYGRPLRRDEVEAILKRHGHPLLVASRYRPHQYLIGPVVFPFYWMALKIVLVLALILTAITCITKIAAADPAHNVIGAMTMIPVQFFSIAASLAAMVTLVAAGVDFCQAKFNWWGKWIPREEFVPAQAKTKITVLPRKPDRRWKSVSHLLNDLLLITWWSLLPRYPQLILGSAHTALRLTPDWAFFYRPILLLLLACLLLHAIPLLRPAWDWLRKMADIATTTLSLVMISYLLKTGNFVALAEGLPDPSHYAQVAKIINTVAVHFLVIASVILPLSILVQIVKLVRQMTAGSIPNNG